MDRSRKGLTRARNLTLHSRDAAKNLANEADHAEVEAGRSARAANKAAAELDGFKGMPERARRTLDNSMVDLALLQEKLAGCAKAVKTTEDDICTVEKALQPYLAPEYLASAGPPTDIGPLVRRQSQPLPPAGGAGEAGVSPLEM